MKRTLAGIAATSIAVALSAVGIAPLAHGQNADFPNQAITLIVPFAPGGSTDIVARLLGKEVGTLLGQSVIIENKAGANTLIGTQQARRAKPDGYTLVIATNGHTSNPVTNKNASYDAIKDFSPVVLVGSTPNLIAVNKNVGVRTLPELEKLAREKGKFPFATAGQGTPQHFTGEQLNQQAKLKLEHVAYKGGGPAAADVMAGHVPMLITGLPPALPLVKAGNIIPIAVTSLKRSPVLPDVPTVAESGHPGFTSTFWFAILGPTGMPPAVVAKLNGAFNQALKNQDLRTQLMSQGVDLAGGSPQELASFLQSDVDGLRKLIAAAGIQIN
ncbi:tripartite tricarboxylate transporter substrate binding protein [Lacisediminimonas sp.]|uniref:Bug family tripartite tricarboxylate transporter substrate binding protein n=1 Tax=Lacisediminimonas sp. TaxID=3060582 RepID=UPI00271AEABB|nr:tripartite tricarboxylate transporter substrate binding protein [Lacisediminimonas sp.]MDO8300595.1 tripartite tricarboxylate transporter substrate binding protein [Lacisediminimonas sp.]